MNNFIRIMSLDVGDRTIGMAMSDPMGWTAQGLHTIRRESDEKDLAALKKVITEYQVTQLVVGLPINMNGTIGPQAEKVRAFIEQIRPEIPCSITEWDERLSTKMAERSLIEADMRRSKRKKIIDTAAAVAILQGYLDYLQNKAKSQEEEQL
jgi:putative Holliday junction resolvase